jgi:hypothetical protein
MRMLLLETNEFKASTAHTNLRWKRPWQADTPAGYERWATARKLCVGDVPFVDW